MAIENKNTLIWRSWFKDDAEFVELVKEFNFTKDLDGIIFLALRTYGSAIGYHPKWKIGQGWTHEEEDH